MQVIITPRVLKQFNRLPKIEQVKIKKKLSILEQYSQEGKKLSGEFSELRSLKSWPYRIIYFIDSKQRKIFIVMIVHRQGVYK